MSAPDHPAALAAYPFLHPVTVNWGEMDAFQHVNNTVYFRWFEAARIAHGMACGLLGDGRGAGPILAGTSARYRRPVVFPDQLLVGVRIGRIAEDRFWQQYAIYSRTQDALCTEGEAEIVWFDYKQARKCPMPADLIARIEAIEGQPLRREPS